MKEIKFNIPLNEAYSRKNVSNFLSSKKPLHGPGKNILKIKKHLKKIFGFKMVHLTNSCTSALEMSALMLNLKKNDEIILPSFSFVTTASSFARTGCKLRYCDIDKNNLMPTFNQIKKCVNQNTKAIVIIHYQGYSVDYLNLLKDYCNRKKIFLIEDAAQALGSYFKKKPLGTFGDFACFSFHETKNIHSGVGGMLVVNNKKYIRRSHFVFDKGTDRYLVKINKQKYYYWVDIGSSFLLTEFSASYLYPQIVNLKKIIKIRSIIYKRYIYNLSKWLDDEFIITNNFIYKYNFHALVIVLKNKKRENFFKYLKKYRINAVISYTPLHKSKFGKQFFKHKHNLSNTNFLNERIVRLPMHNYLKIKQVDFICNKMKLFFKK